MSLVSTFAHALYGALPPAVRHPAPRDSEAMREFDALMHELDEVEPLAPPPPHDASLHLTAVPADSPSRAVQRRARHH